ncbi:MAG: GTP-binding protein [Gemmobacter sp.]|jgi:G3E family GTPase|nr:GTP-binding protein [Gemmobacter sp.]
MICPVILVTGFLGAGKTTFINSVLTRSGNRSIAAIVNDFGAINIDEELIGTDAETVVGLANGCICCTIQGDLLRTLKLLQMREPPVGHVIIEASGVADPAGIIAALADPVLWQSFRLDTVICVVDAQEVTDRPARRRASLWQAQVAAADLLVVSRSDTVSNVVAKALAASRSPSGKPPVLDLAREGLPDELLFGMGGISPECGAGSAPPRQAPRYFRQRIRPRTLSRADLRRGRPSQSSVHCDAPADNHHGAPDPARAPPRSTRHGRRQSDGSCRHRRRLCDDDGRARTRGNSGIPAAPSDGENPPATAPCRSF